MKVISKIEKLWIKKTIESKGYCCFSNSFFLDLLIMNGEYYNKHFLGIKTDRYWEDDNFAFSFDFEDDEPATITVCREDGSEYILKSAKESYKEFQLKHAVDNDSFVWVKQPQIFEEVYKIMGKQIDFAEFEKTANQPFVSLDQLINNVENWLDEHGPAMMKLVKTFKDENEPEDN